MADVTIDGAIGQATRFGARTLVFTSALVGYQFYVDSDGAFVYSKTSDGGATWGAAVTISADAAHGAWDVWWDGWTPGDSGTLIHTWYVSDSDDDVLYRALDTNGDSLGTERTVFGGASADLSSLCTGTKARGGNLYCAFNMDDGTEVGFYRSTDGGVTWGSRSNPVEADGDLFELYPGNEADDEDAWLVYFDQSTGELTLKTYDDSGNSWSESSAFVTGMTTTSATSPAVWPWGGLIRESDRHLLLTVVTEFDTGSSDHRMFDINGAGSITEKTAIASNVDDHYYPAIFLSDAGRLYVAYVGNLAGTDTSSTSVGVYYVYSDDGGASWSAEQAYSAGAAGYRSARTPLTGSRFLVTWHRDLNTMLTNTDNARNGLAASVSGNQPAGSGRLIRSSWKLAGAQAAPSGAVAVRWLLAHVSLAGAQAAPSGEATGSVGRFVALAGNQPEAFAGIEFAHVFQHASVGGSQGAPSGVMAERWLLANRTLAGNQGRPTGRVLFEANPRTRVILGPGVAQIRHLPAGSARAHRP